MGEEKSSSRPFEREKKRESEKKAGSSSSSLFFPLAPVLRATKSPLARKSRPKSGMFSMFSATSEVAQGPEALSRTGKSVPSLIGITHPKKKKRVRLLFSRSLASFFFVSFPVALS